MKPRNCISRATSLGALLFMLAGGTAIGQELSCDAYGEAPELAAQVAEGTLPPAAERLPASPLVVTPANEIGSYGGTLYDLYDGNRLAEFRKFGYEGLVRWSVDGSEVIPNIAESWEVLGDGREYIFKLREGMRWSDGEPFTADDIVFWWDRVENNREIVAGGPYPTYLVNGQPARVTKIDDQHVSFAWDEPNGLFLVNLSTPYGVRATQFPKHYLEQFDNQADPEGVAQMMAEAGQTAYGAWWISRVGTYGQQAEYNDPDRPTLQAWMPTAPYIGAERFTFVRNPYYFKVDPECNQLPYIGERTFTLATDPEVRLLKTIAGEDAISRDEISVPINRSVFFENLESGNYRFVDVVSSDFNTMLLHLQLNHPDPVQAEILNNKDFRIGLSHAMDRQTVIDVVFFGQGEPFQQGPRPNSPFYNEQLAKQYTEFDLDLANEYLDKVLPERDGEGFRLRPDGKRFQFAVMANSTAYTYMLDALQILERTWEEAGVDIVVISASDDTFWSRRHDATIDAFVWLGQNGSGLQPIPAADFHAFTPEAAWSWIAWQSQQRNPDAALTSEPVEPPETIRRQYEIIDELKLTFDADEQTRLMNELLTISAEDFYTIGVSLPAGDYKVVASNLGNVPETMQIGWLYPGPAPINFETLYITGQQ